MKKRKRENKKNNQKIIISIFSLIILLILTLFGVNLDQINEYGNTTKDNEITQNQIQEENNQEIINGELAVYFIDVGQADSVLIVNQDDAMLIDAGNNEDGKDVVKFIKEKGVQELKYVVGTHPHEDHIGGLDDVINSDLKIENILMPKIQTNTKTFEDVLDAIKNKGLTVTSPKKGDNFKIGESNCEVMTESIVNEDNLNLSSIVIKLEFGRNSFLFMGDSEKENEQTINWPKTDVLKVGHHGSVTSSSEDFLNQVKPSYAIIMAGKNNSYGLPKEKILNRLKTLGTQIYRTDENGTIKVVSDGNKIEVLKST